MKKKNDDKGKSDLDEIIKVYQLMVKQGLAEINWDQGKTKLLIRRKSSRVRPSGSASAVPPREISPENETVPVEPEQKKIKGTDNIESPMNGIFYRSPSPGIKPFIKDGDTVSAGQTICIIEAMKSMNEIKAERECKILKTLVADGESVTVGQPIYSILPK